MCLLLYWMFPAVSQGAGPPPVISVQPLDETVAKGDTAVFTVTATSSTTLTYQWYFLRTAIKGANTSALTLPNVTYSQAGPYWVAVRNAGGTVNSRQAMLTVTNTPPVGKNDGYTLNEDTTLTVAAPGVLANDLDANGDGLMATLVSGTSHGVVVLNTNGSFTYSPAGNYNGADSFTYQPSDGQALGNTATVILTVNAINDAPVPANLSVIVPNNAATNLVLSATDVDSSVLTYAIVTAPTKGVLSASNGMNGAVTYTPFTNSVGADSFAFTAFDGSLYSTGQVSILILAAPWITTEPQSQAIIAGRNVSFLVVANGTTPLTYQWTFNGAPMEGATASTLTITNVPPAVSGDYTVIVTNSLGSVTSAVATLTVYTPPVITTQPFSQTLRQGLDAVFTVAAMGTSPLSYQWRFNGTPLPGATNSVLAWSNVQTNDAGAYSVSITNVAGSATSTVATLTVIDSTFHFLQPWTATYNGTANNGDFVQALAVDTLGNIYVTGYAKEAASGNYDYVTLKYDSSGTLLWRAVYDGTDQDDQGRALAVDACGNVYVTGSSKGNGSGWDYVTVKYDNNGNQLWAARYNGTANKDDYASALVVSTNGDVFVTGASKGADEHFNYVTIKYDSAGNQIWLNRYVGPGNEDDACSITLDPGGNVYVTGKSKGSGSDFDYSTIKYSSDGTQMWVARYNGPGNQADAAAQVITDPAGNVYVTGSSINAAGKNDYTTIKYDADGNQLWIAIYDGPAAKDDYAVALALDATGSVFVTGTSAVTDTKADFATIKYSPEGAPLWVQRYDYGDDDQAVALGLDPAGDVYVTGNSRTSSTGYDFATVKYRSLDGAQMAVARYNSSGNLNDSAMALVVDGQHNVYVAGQGFDPLDYVLVQYRPSYLAPAVLTQAASDLTAGSAVLNGAVNPEGAATTWFFQYGLTTNYDGISASVMLQPFTQSVPVTTGIVGLQPGTLYHFRLVATNAAGTIAGQDMTLSTLAIPPMQLSIRAEGPYMHFSLASVAGAHFTLLSSTDVVLPVTDWTVVGPMAETAAGLYEFTLSQPATNPVSFFRLRSP